VPALANNDRPNILLLVAEDLSDKVAAFGDTLAVTPNIDALAEQGVRFPNTFTTAGVCSPSRAALITGLHQNSIGAGHMRSAGFALAKYKAVPPSDVKAFPELLRKAGYFTYVNLKNDYQFSGFSATSGPSTIWDKASRTPHGVNWADRPDGKPFFGMYTFMETHESGTFPRNIWPRSKSHLTAMMVHNYLHWGVEDVITPEEVTVPPYYPETPTVRRDIARQYNNVRTMDIAVGQVLNQLKADGLADDTIVIWTTDHGDGLPRAKRELFDSGIKVPLLIAWPEKFRPKHVTPGSVDKQLVSFVDLAPTILAMAGVEPSQHMQGQKLPPANSSSSRQYIFAAKDRNNEVPDRQRAVRDNRYKYILNYMPELPAAGHLAYRDDQDIMIEMWDLLEQGKLNAVQRLWFEPRSKEELYDTQLDPHEVNNLAENPGHQHTLVRMREALKDWQRRVPDMGAMEEAEMAELFWPGGKGPITLPPQIDLNNDTGMATIHPLTKGASIDYRRDDGDWQLYNGAVSLNPGESLTAKSVRYGWLESKDVVVTLKDLSGSDVH